mgnify:CR=1 FL=1
MPKSEETIFSEADQAALLTAGEHLVQAVKRAMSHAEGECICDECVAQYVVATAAAALGTQLAIAGEDYLSPLAGHVIAVCGELGDRDSDGNALTYHLHFSSEYITAARDIYRDTLANVPTGAMN